MNENDKETVHMDLCPFCGKLKTGSIKKWTWGKNVTEWFMCVDCEKELKSA